MRTIPVPLPDADCIADPDCSEYLPCMEPGCPNQALLARRWAMGIDWYCLEHGTDEDEPLYGPFVPAEPPAPRRGRRRKQ